MMIIRPTAQWAFFFQLPLGYNPSLSRSLVDPIFRPGVFDRLRRLRRLYAEGDGRGFLVKDSTRVAPKELIHRVANPVRMSHLQSKGFVERILDRICGAFDHGIQRPSAASFI